MPMMLLASAGRAVVDGAIFSCVVGGVTVVVAVVAVVVAVGAVVAVGVVAAAVCCCCCYCCNFAMYTWLLLV